MEPKDTENQQEADRFDHIEVGRDIQRVSADASEGKCVYCGTVNEADRARCRGCFRRMPRFVPLAQQDQQLEVDGITYRRNDPNLPEEIRVLMDRVAKEGYSLKLMQEWRYWRATRHAPRSMPSTGSQQVPPWSDSQDMPTWTGGRGRNRYPPHQTVPLIVFIIISVLGFIFRFWLYRW